MRSQERHEDAGTFALFCRTCRRMVWLGRNDTVVCPVCVSRLTDVHDEQSSTPDPPAASGGERRAAVNE